MDEKYFRVKWKCGWYQYVRGTSLLDALFKAGYAADEEDNIKNHSEADSLPTKNKEVIILNGNSEPFCEFRFDQHNIIADGIRDVINERAPDFDGDIIILELLNSTYKYFLESVGPFKIVCRFLGHELIK